MSALAKHAIHPDSRRAIARVMTEAGIEGYRFEMGGKHPRLVFSHGGRERFYVLLWSPSDSVRGAQNCESELRRIVGLRRPGKSTGTPVRRRRRKVMPKRQGRAPEPVAPVKPDPFAVLRTWQPAPGPAQENPAPPPSLWRRLLTWIFGARNSQ